MVIDVGPFLV